MLQTRIPAILAVLFCLWAAPAALAAEVDCDSVYCFSPHDFSEDETLRGICLTDLPDGHLGAVRLGSRVLRPGDILTEAQLGEVTFSPVSTEEDLAAQITYLPIFDNRVEPSQTVTIAIRGREDQAPVAEDSAHETYKNLPLEDTLRARDPEGQAMRFTLLRSPRRGTVELHDDGTFTYTPKKNKVGTDSFSYTVTDPAGNVSREATVTLHILKPSDAPQYTDTAGRDCRFAAEWMKNTGIFVGEQLNGNPCFCPDKPVTRGEFLAMLVNTLDIPLEEDAAFTGYTDEIPLWLRPYLAAALRSGLTAGLPDTGTFGANENITGAEAAVLLQNALDLSAEAKTDAAEEAVSPAWAENALAAMSANGFRLPAVETLTREEAALCLYQAARLADFAPGTQILRQQ